MYACIIIEMSFIPSTGPISFSNIRNALGQSASMPTGMGDLYNSSLFAPFSGEVSAAEVRGITTNPIFQSFAPDIQSSASGVYSVRLVNSNYTGAILNIRRSSDNTSNDFYGDYVGNLKLIDGTKYDDWSNGNMSIMTWYDQSGGNRHANATSGYGGTPPLLVKEPTGTGKYCVYFPNSNANSNQYYGFTTPIQSTRSLICNYYTMTKTALWQVMLAQSNAETNGLRIINTNQIISGGGNEFLTGGGFAIFNGTFSTTTPFVTNTLNAWHTLACSRTFTSNANFVHIGHLSVTASTGTLQSRSFHGYMTDLYTFSNPLSLIPVPASSNNPEFQITFKNNHIPFWRNGLVGSYVAESFSNNQWLDVSGCNNHATSITGTVATSNVTSISGLGGLPYLAGDTSASVIFPNAILPINYTLFHVSRYNGTNQGRILTSPDLCNNWLSGHWSGKSGVAFHSNWITQSTNSMHGSNWVLSTDQNNLYRSGQSNRTSAVAGAISYASNIGINPSNTGSLNKSDWAIANVLVYNRTLPSNQYLAIEDYLASRYSLPFPIQEGLVLSLCANDFISGGTSWIDRTGLGNNFNLSSSNVFGVQSGFNCMRCGGATGFLGALGNSNTPIGNYNTFITFTQLSNYTTDWRTALKGNVLLTDHQLIINNGTNNLGYWNNGATGANGTGGFIPFDTNVDVSTLPNVYTKFNMWVTHHSTTTPFVEFYYNPSNLPLTRNGVIANNTGAAIKQGVCWIGSFSNGQYFGNVAQVMIYNRKLADRELVDIFNRYKNFYGL
jgi:hypothetical protein